LAVHLPLISAPRRWPGSWLQPGSPVAPARSHLPLLPPGPDGVHEFAPHGTGPSTLLTRCWPWKLRNRGQGL